jgi:hypothetical protein
MYIERVGFITPEKKEPVIYFDRIGSPQMPQSKEALPQVQARIIHNGMNSAGLREALSRASVLFVVAYKGHKGPITDNDLNHDNWLTLSRGAAAIGIKCVLVSLHLEDPLVVHSNDDISPLKVQTGEKGEHTLEIEVINLWFKNRVFLPFKNAFAYEKMNAIIAATK